MGRILLGTNPVGSGFQEAGFTESPWETPREPEQGWLFKRGYLEAEAGVRQD
jgi:hypothetical protein